MGLDRRQAVLVLAFAALIGIGLGLAIRFGARGGSEAGSGGVSPGTPGGGSEGRIVVASIPPLAWAARELAGSGWRVETVVAPGRSPHGFELTPGQADAIARADAVLLVGASFERSIERVLERSARGDGPVVVRLRDVLGESAAVQGEEGRPMIRLQADPHLWLDPVLMGAFVESAGLALGADAQRTAAAVQACRDVDAEYRQALSAHKGAVLVTHHAAYGWLARRYGLVVGAEVIPGAALEPTAASVAAVRDLIEREGLGAIFVEPQLDAATPRRIAELTGVRVLTLDPLGEGDWPATMRANLRALLDGLTPRAP